MRRGVIETAFAVWLGCVVAMGVAAYQLRDSHRERKAIQFCEEAGVSDCEGLVSSWSKEKILTVIGDNPEGEQARKAEFGTPVPVGNGGNFIGGLMVN